MATLPNQPDAAAAFLRGLVQIHLTAIPADGGAVRSRDFGTDVAAACAWAAVRNAKSCGIYWTVNLVRPGLNRKPAKADIDAARFVHLDIDPPHGAGAWDKDAVVARLRAASCSPSMILDSGNGVQAFWRLTEPTDCLDRVEAINIGVRHAFNGDACHNIDRLMRVPGFTNWPNPKKQAAGRKPELASLIEPESGQVYTLEELEAAYPPPPTITDHPVPPPSGSPSGSGAGSTGAQHLVPPSERLDRLILEADPYDQFGGDMSAQLLSGVNLMIQAGWSDEEIHKTCLDPANIISDHPRRQPDPRRAIERSIEKARTSLNDKAAVSEDSLARAFSERTAGTFLFDHSLGKWFHWAGASWKEDNRKLAFEIMRGTARQLGKGERSLSKSTTIAGALRIAQSDPQHATSTANWNADPMLLGTPAGTVDLRTGQLRPASPAERIVKVAACSPAAGDPTRWQAFLHEALAGDVETIAFLQRWCGYCLTGLTKEHALLFLLGLGGNGKSVFVNTVAGILGEYAVTATMEAFTESKFERHSTELAMLQGARLVTASETERGRSWQEARIKSLTGGDPITARYMRQDNFTYRPEFKLMIAGNHAPRLANVDDAMQRRINFVPFNVKPQRPDPDLEEKLREEWPQILQWMIDGCSHYDTVGLLRPKSVTAANADYFAEQDAVGQWLADCCELAPDHWERTSVLFSAWQQFALRAGYPLGVPRWLTSELRRRGFQVEKRGGDSKCCLRLCAKESPT
jgi:putative DNA primase/helicase